MKGIKIAALFVALMGIAIAVPGIAIGENPHGDKTDPNASCQHTPTGQGKPSGECNDQGLPQSEGCQHGQAPFQNPHCTTTTVPTTTTTTPSTTTTTPSTTTTTPSTTTTTPSTTSTTPTSTTPTAPATGVPPSGSPPSQATGVSPGQSSQATGNVPTTASQQAASPTSTGTLAFTGEHWKALALIGTLLLALGGSAWAAYRLHQGERVPGLSRLLD